MSHEWDKFAVHKEPPEVLRTKLQPPVKTLMGPGPTNCSERVLRSLQHQIIGHLQPEAYQVVPSHYSCPKSFIEN